MYGTMHNYNNRVCMVPCIITTIVDVWKTFKDLKVTKTKTLTSFLKIQRLSLGIRPLCLV